MFTDFVCFQFYFRDYVAQPCSQIGTAYICSSIKVLSRNAQRRIFVDCAGVRFIIAYIIPETSYVSNDGVFIRQKLR